ncbi:MAG TPA: hypothetical protein ENJ18_07125 [Nannocystis exedens]|nr:hypothetical protein [Nannocystis exedens]
MRRLLFSSSLLSALALALPACGGNSGSFNGNGTGVPVDPGQVQVVRSKDDLTEPYKELGTAKAKAATADDALDLAKQHCGRTGGGDLLILNTEPFQSGSVWRVDAICAKSDKPVATGSGGKAIPAGNSDSKAGPSGGKPL